MCVCVCVCVCVCACASVRLRVRVLVHVRGCVVMPVPVLECSERVHNPVGVPAHACSNTPPDRRRKVDPAAKHFHHQLLLLYGEVKVCFMPTPARRSLNLFLKLLPPSDRHSWGSPMR